MEKVTLHENTMAVRRLTGAEAAPYRHRGDRAAKYFVHNEANGLFYFTQDLPNLTERPTIEDVKGGVCNAGQGEKTCRYLTSDAAGFSCQKFGVFKDVLDNRVFRTQMGIATDDAIHAQGDNCPGKLP